MISRLVSKVIILSISIPLLAINVQAAGSYATPPSNEWSFSGIFGTFDKAQFQRGFKVYKEVCASCHSMDLMKYRNLYQKGGPGFTEDQIKALTSEIMVTDGPDETGEYFERPATPVDKFKNPYPNKQAAAAVNGGKVPPDLSVMAKARAPTRGFPNFVYDIFTGHSNQLGVDYIKAFLLGYKEAPEGKEVPPGNYYNEYYPGNLVAMAPVLVDGLVEYSDDSPQTAKQYATDVSAFLMWAAEPHHDARKELGFKVMMFLIIFSFLLYFTNKRLWKPIKNPDEVK